MNNRLQLIAPRQIEASMRNNIPVIDIRRDDEWKETGIIKGSHLLTFFDGFGHYNLEAWMEAFEKIVTTKNKPFILVCAHANRTKTVGDYLVEHLNYAEVYHLDGGIAQWQNEERETVLP